MEYLVLIMAVWLLFGLLTVQAFEKSIDESLDFETQALIVVLWPAVLLGTIVRDILLRR